MVENQTKKVQISTLRIYRFNSSDKNINILRDIWTLDLQRIYGMHNKQNKINYTQIAYIEATYTRRTKPLFNPL